eukprot:787260-Amphidinium_carterae.2
MRTLDEDADKQILQLIDVPAYAPCACPVQLCKPDAKRQAANMGVGIACPAMPGVWATLTRSGECSAWPDNGRGAQCCLLIDNVRTEAENGAPP